MSQSKEFQDPTCAKNAQAQPQYAASIKAMIDGLGALRDYLGHRASYEEDEHKRNVMDQHSGDLLAALKVIKLYANSNFNGVQPIPLSIVEALEKANPWKDHKKRNTPHSNVVDALKRGYSECVSKLRELLQKELTSKTVK